MYTMAESRFFIVIGIKKEDILTWESRYLFGSVRKTGCIGMSYHWGSQVI